MKHVLLPVAAALSVIVTFVTFVTFVAAVSGSTRELQNSAAGAGPSAPAAIYGRRCASCHGKDGRAKTFKAKFNSARNLTDSQWQAEVSDERLFNSITNGRGRMPAFGKKLPEGEINSLVTYVRSLKK